MGQTTVAIEKISNTAFSTAFTGNGHVSYLSSHPFWLDSWIVSIFFLRALRTSVSILQPTEDIGVVSETNIQNHPYDDQMFTI